MPEQLPVNWDIQAWEHLGKAYDYIKESSLQNAEKVRTTIIERINKIPAHPTAYGLDKLKNLNDGSYRYFELYHYRTTFKITETEIRILRIRSTYQEPLEH
jgi:hypothetical protein